MFVPQVSDAVAKPGLDQFKNEMFILAPEGLTFEHHFTVTKPSTYEIQTVASCGNRGRDWKDLPVKGDTVFLETTRNPKRCAEQDVHLRPQKRKGKEEQYNSIIMFKNKRSQLNKQRYTSIESIKRERRERECGGEREEGKERRRKREGEGGRKVEIEIEREYQLL